jgi:hypothetical protein
MGFGSTFAQVRCDHRSEMIHPAPDGLISDPAFRQQIFDVAETQREAEIEPDRVLDDFGRKAIAAIADFERSGRYGYRSVAASAPPSDKAVDTDFPRSLRRRSPKKRSRSSPLEASAKGGSSNCPFEPSGLHSQTQLGWDFGV